MDWPSNETFVTGFEPHIQTANKHFEIFITLSVIACPIEYNNKELAWYFIYLYFLIFLGVYFCHSYKSI